MWSESDLCLEASNVLVVLGEDVGGDGVLSLHNMLAYVGSRTVRETYWWDLLWQLNILGESHLPSLERALQVHLLDLLAQIDCCLQQGDKTVLDDDSAICALLNILLQCSSRLDGKSLPAVSLVSAMFPTRTLG